MTGPPPLPSLQLQDPQVRRGLHEENAKVIVGFGIIGLDLKGLLVLVLRLDGSTGLHE